MRTPGTTTNMDRPVNLLKATTTCNTFYVFLSAAKAALLPFLTLFFRLIGLSALETGIVMAAKPLTGFVWAPLWARCAVGYNKRRTVLVFSLLMMAIMYLSFTAVYYKVGDVQSCRPAYQNASAESNASLLGNTSSDNLVPEDMATPLPIVIHSSEKPGSATSSSKHIQNENTTKTTSTAPPKDSIPFKVNTSNSSTGKPATTKPAITESSTISHQVATKHPTSDTAEHQDTAGEQGPPADSASDTDINLESAKEDRSYSHEEIQQMENAFKALTGHTFQDIKDLKLSAHDLYTLAQKQAPNLKISEEEIQEILDLSDASAQASARKESLRTKRTLNVTFFNNIKDKVGSLAATLEEKKLLLFLVVLLIIIFGEFFSSPVEKIADDAWFDFLERIDDMEKYGRQRYWGSLTFAIVPIVVSAVVDYTPCKMLFNMHHFLMHFYVFGVFMIFTLFLAFYFPMPPPAKQKYTSKVCKGLRAICCDGRGFLFVVTLLVAGMVYASFNNFLFWRLQDLGGSEVTMGLCVAIGTFAETPMLIFSNKLVTKLGNAGVVSLSLFALALRVLFYGFLWTPWAVLPAELTNAFTHTALWYAILSYDEFNVGSAFDRSIRSILSSIYFGLGFSLGSFISGVVYHVYGASFLFWGASVLSGAWCLVFSLIQCCLPKKERVRYIKLLRNEEDESSDGEDDWLEMALKDQ